MAGIGVIWSFQRSSGDNLVAKLLHIFQSKTVTGGFGRSGFIVIQVSRFFLILLEVFLLSLMEVFVKIAIQ